MLGSFGLLRWVLFGGGGGVCVWGGGILGLCLEGYVGVAFF